MHMIWVWCLHRPRHIQHMMEVFMAFDKILMHRREISEGPGAKAWALGQIADNPTPVQLGVRGLTSDCNCTGVGRCEFCKESTSVWLLIVGTFNPDLHQRGFVFWGYINRDAKGEALCRAPRPDHTASLRSFVSAAPNRSQLVFGWYDPYPYHSLERRGWITPVEGDLEELFRKLVNTDMLRRDFPLWGHHGGYDFNVVGIGQHRILPDWFWGMLQRQSEAQMTLRHVERQVEGVGYFKVTGMRTLDTEGRLMYVEDGQADGATWFRFMLTFEFIVDIGADIEAYDDAWIDVRADGYWSYIWARLPDGSKVSWVYPDYSQ
ncbi:MAG: hypothetical protein UU04_C0021G0023 [Candidatus Uhrbacteria bacterium GW2011_GWC2_40_450]|uniref:Uncharacterized protein n=1 Tax=Candidatus Uhrbacteria bacterium GW2011_GWC1_41_20 TaxID=1618983 RepID=A0A0G0VH38_9BACT|nr:MAG: hypothetical protein UT52_C0018G0025 [Candidatus Uhrbacteria bacterium GW2011_GWE1_39_46]KKR63300.1 MAG: hypothetical protein UU04_C0021G0023 [Candidatus Uhrbacteria bacterium GW2011_GWC2_40_450]KKR98966.1 MAG: hypothetical protein UU50_C0012G0014 [Candidatus Uhrbacteria bacterium GW2011_GWC1_41_20]KKS07244.1 MAG: hypothetical protein UU62_C0020G0047 [Candidatus Uhrbacteria bacterium GW2011_GWF2_41_40]KKS17092.1 MAG: hypothetical protein UU75_C0024G0015 [Candidatus Uhrbacteria bacterium